MSLFNRKETIVLKSEQQKDAYIERLEKPTLNMMSLRIGTIFTAEMYPISFA